jgi:NAD-dependent deacetylase
MPHDKLQEAFACAGCADLVVSVGSTLEVEPAASVPRSAQDNGATYVVINQGPTAHDQLADLRIEDDLNVLLPATVNEVRALCGEQ